jgi:hypothetical protein
VTTVGGGREFVTTRDGRVIRVEGPAEDWQAWQAGQVAAARAGRAEITLPD